MNNIWFSSDHHWSDNNALKYRYRPFDDIEEMNTKMVELWNKYVQPEDTVYYLGDFAVSDEGVERFAPILNGNMKIILGNHDCCRINILSKYFEIIKNPMLLEINDRKLWLSHYPLQRHNDIYSVFGHIHDLGKIFKRSINVSVDAWHFRPILLQTILDSEETEKNGYWDANVYPDADLEWQYLVSTKQKRTTSEFEPTLSILEQKIIDVNKRNILSEK